MNLVRHTIFLCVLTVIAACSEEAPPISVSEFMENPRLLEATMVRCAQNRSQSRYVVECINARDAVNRLEAAQEKARREDLEKQSERKRQALRQTQEAAAEARRRTLEAQRRREEQEYLGIFDQAQGGLDDSASAGGVGGDDASGTASNAPGIEIEAPQTSDENESTMEEDPQEPETDLGAVREELKRRQETNE